MFSEICILSTYLLQNAGSAPKVGCCQWELTSHKNPCPWGGPERGMFFTLDKRTFLQDGAHGCIYCSFWSPGPQEFSNPSFQTCTKLGDYCHIYLSLFFVFFFHFWGRYFSSTGFGINSDKWTSGKNRTRNNPCIFNEESRIAQEHRIHRWSRYHMKFL